MATALKTGILLFWLVMLGMLVERSYLRPAAVIALDVITQEGVRTGDDWFGIYQQGRKIGWANTRLSVEGDAYRLFEESELDILALGQVRRVTTRIDSYATKNFLLKYFDFTLGSTGAEMRIKGAVVNNRLVLDIETGDQVRKDEIALKEPPYLAVNVRPALVLMGLEPGRRYRFPLFNPASLSTEDAFVTVEAKETIKVGNEARTVYKLKETFQGMEAFSWITQDGDTIKEESPLGYVLLKETKTEARKRDKGGPAVDVISLVKIPSSPIAKAETTVLLKARLSNAPFEGFDLDGGRQSFRNGIVEITALPPGPSRQSGLAPAPAENLAATALIQSDDKAIREQAARIVGAERNPEKAARLLNAWVNQALTKMPVVSIPSAVEVLRQRAGDCNEHTVLYTALARAAGIPARMAAGIVYLKNGFYYHAWPEVWLGDWVALDPTFNQFPADATHIRFIAGDLSRQAEIMKLVGKLKVEVLEYK